MTDSLLEPASSGQSINCSFSHIRAWLHERKRAQALTSVAVSEPQHTADVCDVNKGLSKHYWQEKPLIRESGHI